MSNPFRRDYSEKAKYFVITHEKGVKEGWRMATSAGFGSKEDAQKYLESVNPCWKPRIVKVVETGTHQDKRGP